MRPVKRFLRLRGEMKANDIDAKYLAQLMGMSKSAVDRRLRGEYAWCLDEMYRLMEILRWPPERMCDLFPNDVRSVS